MEDYTLTNKLRYVEREEYGYKNVGILTDGTATKVRVLQQWFHVTGCEELEDCGEWVDVPVEIEDN